jgi:hypothetical protein
MNIKLFNKYAPATVEDTITLMKNFFEGVCHLKVFQKDDGQYYVGETENSTYGIIIPIVKTSWGAHAVIFNKDKRDILIGDSYNYDNCYIYYGTSKDKKTIFFSIRNNINTAPSIDAYITKAYGMDDNEEKIIYGTATLAVTDTILNNADTTTPFRLNRQNKVILVPRVIIDIDQPYKLLNTYRALECKEVPVGETVEFTLDNGDEFIMIASSNQSSHKTVIKI